MAAMFGETATYGRINPEDYRNALESAAAAMLEGSGGIVPFKRANE